MNPKGKEINIKTTILVQVSIINKSLIVTISVGISTISEVSTEIYFLPVCESYIHPISKNTMST